MTPALTDADCEAFERWFAASKYCQVVYSAASYQPCMDGYAAGLAAGMERAAKVCDEMMIRWKSAPDFAPPTPLANACAAAIRASAKD